MCLAKIPELILFPLARKCLLEGWKRVREAQLSTKYEDYIVNKF